MSMALGTVEGVVEAIKEGIREDVDITVEDASLPLPVVVDLRHQMMGSNWTKLYWTRCPPSKGLPFTRAVIPCGLRMRAQALDLSLQLVVSHTSKLMTCQLLQTVKQMP
jgi:hypothetical protein